jgi:hypothetical protein
MLRHQQFVRSLALAGMATAALIAPHAAMARPAADVNGTLPAKHVLVDLRSPDAATPVTIQPTQVDLRSPDAATPVHIVPQAPQPHPIGSPSGSSDDFDFGDAAIGAGGALLVALACAGSMVAVTRRRPSLGH